MEPDALATVGHAIQLSVAPVFLLSGIGAMLAVMTNRLARIVDRARAVEARLPNVGPDDLESSHGHLRVFSRRAKLINKAITFCTITAILICTVIAILFLGAFLGFDASMTVAALFISAMSTFIIGLVFFLREIFVATKFLRIGSQ